MRKKFNYVFMCLLFWLALTGNVYADNISVSAVTSNSKIVKGEMATVDIKLTADVVVSNCLFKFSGDEGIVFNSSSSVNGWYVTSGVDGILVEGSLNNTNTPNDLNVLKVNYVVNNSGKLTVESQCVSIDEKVLYPQNNASVEFTVIEPEDDTTLKSLSVKNGKAIDFKPDSLIYTTTIETSTFGLEFNASNPDYDDDIVVKVKDGEVIQDVNNITFNDPTGQGQMILNIIVNGKTTYELDIVYIKKELDNSLDFIRINGSNLSLKKDVFDYVFEIGNDVDSVEVFVGLKDNENFKIGSGSNIDPDTLKKNFTMSNNEEYVHIVVEPKDSSSGATSVTYRITIEKKDGGTPPVEDEPKPGKPIEDDGTLKNPETGGISMFVMLLILIASLIGSVYLYRKNLESYK